MKVNRNGHQKIRKLKARLLVLDPICTYCYQELTQETATIDHRIPLSRGGSNRNDNLVLACSDCNQRKADKISV